MVLLHQPPGLANMLMNFFAGYALAKELGEELKLDITFKLRKNESYVLNLLKLLETNKVYRLLDHYEHVSKENDPFTVAPEFQSDFVRLVQPGVYIGEETDNILFYDSLEDAKTIRRKIKNKDILLHGYFFNSKYHDKYWYELKDMVALKKETYFTKAFSKIIEGKESVGIHIRRGDFQAFNHIVEEREYWQAAVMLMRELLKDPVFMVFSDDIDYAVSVLGIDSRIYYVKALGSQRADLEEFICLSRCDHRILTLKSTFGGLADNLHGGTRIAVYKGINIVKEAIEKENNNRETNLRANGKRRVLLYPDEIAKRASMYHTDGNMPIPPPPPISDIKLNCDNSNAYRELEKISFQAVCLKASDIATRDKMLYEKMQADMEIGNLEEAYEDSRRIYVKYASDLNFQRMLRNILLKLGYENEAAIEEARDYNKPYHFIIAPYMDTMYSDYCLGLTELGNILYHMGNSVTYLFDTLEESEIWYIKNNSDYVDRREGKKGGKQFLIADLIKEYGSLSEFFKQINILEDTVLVTRSPMCLTAAKANRDIITVFPDFSDNRCMESIYAKKHMSDNDLNRLYNEADIVFSHNYRKENSYDWQDRGHFNYADEINSNDDVINLGCHFQPLYVGLAFALLDVLQKKYRRR